MGLSSKKTISNKGSDDNNLHNISGLHKVYLIFTDTWRFDSMTFYYIKPEAW